MREAMPPPAAHEGPLAGLRIVLTRPREQAGDFEQAVMSLGGRPVIAPAIAIAPPDDWSALDGAIDRIGDFDWIAFTSGNAVTAFIQRARIRGVPAVRVAHIKLGVVGPATAGVLARELRAPDAIAQSASAEGLGEGLPVKPGARVLIPHGDLAGDALVTLLRERRADPTAVVAYRTVPGPGIPSIVKGIREGSIDALLFASGSAVRFVADALTDGQDRADRPERDGARRPAIFCIGPSTAQEAAAVGFAADGIATAATQRALLDETIRWFAARRTRSA